MHAENVNFYAGTMSENAHVSHMPQFLLYLLQKKNCTNKTRDRILLHHVVNRHWMTIPTSYLISQIMWNM